MNLRNGCKVTPQMVSVVVAHGAKMTPMEFVANLRASATDLAKTAQDKLAEARQLASDAQEAYEAALNAADQAKREAMHRVGCTRTEGTSASTDADLIQAFLAACTNSKS